MTVIMTHVAILPYHRLIWFL